MFTFTFLLVVILLVIVFHKWNTIQIRRIIPLWLFISFIAGVILYSIFTNFNYLLKPDSTDPFLAFLIFLYFILPIFILLFLNVYESSVFLLKITSFILTVVLLILSEALLEKLTIIKDINWNLGYSALLWTTITLISIIFYRFINHIFSKEEVF